MPSYKKLKAQKGIEYVWMRIGDMDDYEHHDNPYDAGNELATGIRDKDFEIKYVSAGVEIIPYYANLNYVSLFWGDDDAQWIRDLSPEEKEEFERGLYENIETSASKKASYKKLKKKAQVRPDEPANKLAKDFIMEFPESMYNREYLSQFVKDRGYPGSFIDTVAEILDEQYGITVSQVARAGKIAAEEKEKFFKMLEYEDESSGKIIKYRVYKMPQGHYKVNMVDEKGDEYKSGYTSDYMAMIRENLKGTDYELIYESSPMLGSSKIRSYRKFRKEAQKFDYTREELLQEGWATIGGRIEDYKEIYMEEPGKAYNKILEDYGEENVDDVYRGLVAFANFGADFYYKQGEDSKIQNGLEATKEKTKGESTEETSYVMRGEGIKSYWKKKKEAIEKKTKKGVIKEVELDESVRKFVEDIFNIPITIEKVLQDDETGAETCLVKSERGNWYIVWSSGDVSEYGKREDEARKYLDSLEGREGEII